MDVQTSEINERLLSRYEPRKWVKVLEAPSCNIGGRYCDMLAFGVWRSSGNEIIGHEVKASRNDWLKELDNPEKSEAFTPYCHRWYIVAPKGVVKLEELQADWGLMVVSGSGLKIRRQAKKQKTPEPIPQNMMAAILRRITEVGMEQEIRKRIRRQERSIQTEIKRSVESATRFANREIAKLKDDIERFEQQSGVSIRGWDNRDIGESVKYLHERDPEQLASEYRTILKQVTDLNKFASDAVVALEATT